MLQLVFVGSTSQASWDLFEMNILDEISRAAFKILSLWEQCGVLDVLAYTNFSKAVINIKKHPLLSGIVPQLPHSRCLPLSGHCDHPKADSAQPMVPGRSLVLSETQCVSKV